MLLEPVSFIVEVAQSGLAQVDAMEVMSVIDLEFVVEQESVIELGSGKNSAGESNKNSTERYDRSSAEESDKKSAEEFDENPAEESGEYFAGSSRRHFVEDSAEEPAEELDEDSAERYCNDPHSFRSFRSTSSNGPLLTDWNRPGRN